ncbi:hypothetical protein KUTeg_002662 [Tegillarca granosa]|uniref:DUF7789 domain-containing protein n=1 Tax=Tegillarca granosa TaxID=220873 RepID=A0ABQ9FZC8_TEGGR|nr:hypothetical protein KUTeg_002662 [Tegillarca granosa]
MDVQQESVAEAQNEPITFEDLGIKKGPQLADTPLGKRREIKDLSKKEIVFVLISVCSLLATLVMTIYKLATITDRSSTDFTFAIVLLLNTVFCGYYLVHGVLLERPYEIGVLVIATFIVWLYIIINFALAVHKDRVKMARLIVASILSPAIIILGLLIGKHYHDSGRLIFRTVGASSEDQAMLLVKSATEMTDKTEPLAVTTFTCAGLAFVIHIFVCLFFALAFRNFGKGLKQKGEYCDLIYRLQFYNHDFTKNSLTSKFCQIEYI